MWGTDIKIRKWGRKSLLLKHNNQSISITFLDNDKAQITVHYPHTVETGQEMDKGTKAYFFKQSPTVSKN